MLLVVEDGQDTGVVERLDDLEFRQQPAQTLSVFFPMMPGPRCTAELGSIRSRRRHAWQASPDTQPIDKEFTST